MSGHLQLSWHGYEKCNWNFPQLEYLTNIIEFEQQFDIHYTLIAYTFSARASYTDTNLFAFALINRISAKIVKSVSAGFFRAQTANR